MILRASDLWPEAGATKPNMRGRGRVPAGGMNGLEGDYAAHLEFERLSGIIVWWRFEGMRLHLAPRTTYTPDFNVMRADGTIEMHETKGHREDDYRVKIKVARSMFPFPFLEVQREAGGGWKITEI